MPVSGFLLQHWVPRHREGDCGLSSGPRLPPPRPASHLLVQPLASSRQKENTLSGNTMRLHPGLPCGPSGSCLSWTASSCGGETRPHELPSPSQWLQPNWGFMPGTGGLATTSRVQSVPTPRGPSPNPPSVLTDAGDRRHAGLWWVSRPQASVPGWGRRPATELEGPRDGESRAWLKHYLEFPDGQQTVNPRAGPWVCAQGHTREAGPGCDVSARPGRCGQERAPFTAGMCPGRQDRETAALGSGKRSLAARKTHPEGWIMEQFAGMHMRTLGVQEPCHSRCRRCRGWTGLPFLPCCPHADKPLPFL